MAASRVAVPYMTTRWAASVPIRYRRVRRVLASIIVPMSGIWEFCTDIYFQHHSVMNSITAKYNLTNLDWAIFGEITNLPEDAVAKDE